MRQFGLISLSLACSLATPAAAETLTVHGTYGANADVPAEIETLVVEPFGGEAGAALALAIGDELAASRVRGRPWYEVVPLFGEMSGDVAYLEPEDADGVISFRPQERGARGEGILSGFGRLAIDDVYRRTKTVVHCRRKVDKKCVEEEVVEYECRQLNVRIWSDVRVFGPDGRQLYTHTATPSRSEDYCTDEAMLPTVDELADPMLKAIAREVRRDLAPDERIEDIRLMERRKGLDRAVAKRFEEALKLTKNDPYAACQLFGEIDRLRPSHGSVLFNRGLCSESVGDLDDAGRYYERALAAGASGSYPQAGLERIASRVRGLDQIEARQERATATLSVETSATKPQ